MNSQRVRQLEDNINSTPLFSLDPQRDISAYEREKNRLISELYEYITECRPEYECYGLELTETALRCIAGFDAEKGDFLHYFNNSFRYARMEYEQKEQLSIRTGGIRLSDGDRRLARAYDRFLRNSSLTPDEDSLRRFAESIGRDPEPLRQRLDRVSELRAVSSCQTDESGESVDLFELLSAGRTEEPDSLRLAGAEELLDSIEAAFLKRQERQKPILSELLTVKILPALSTDPQLLRTARGKTFFSEVMFERCKSGEPPTAKEIGRIHGRSEQSVSRTYREFLLAVKQNSNL